MRIRLKQLCPLICCGLVALGCNQQEGLTTEEAIEHHKALQNTLDNTDYNQNPDTWLELSLNINQALSQINNDHSYILRSHHNTAYDYLKNELYNASLNKYKEFFKYYELHESEFSTELKNDIYKGRSFNYRSLAVTYEKLGHLDSAYFEHQKNLKLINTTNDIFRPAANNDFGMFLAGSLKDTAAALKEYKKAYTFTLKNFPEHALIGSIRDNLGNIYLNKQRFDEAYDLFVSNYAFYKKYLKRNPEYVYRHKAMVSASKSAEILRLQNKTQQLDNLFRDVTEFYNTARLVPNENPKIKLEFLNLKMQHLLAHQYFKKSHQILGTIKILSDSINVAESNYKESLQSKLNDLTLYTIKYNHQLEKHQKEAALLNQKLIIWIISILSIAFLGVLGFLFYRRKKQVVIARGKQRIIAQELEIASIRNTKLNLEITSKKRDLSDFAINLSQNQEWAKELAIKLEALKRTKGRARKKLMDDFENEVVKKTTFDTNTKAFFERLDKLSDSFYSQLNSEFPDLSKTEKRLCSLIRLKIESANIATIQNITIGSLNTSRYRLRKKLDLAKEDDLDTFIQNL